MNAGSSFLYARGGCIVTSRQGGARQDTHRLPQLIPELAMKHRPFKAIDISPGHHGRRTKLCRESRNFPRARRNADRRSEAGT